MNILEDFQDGCRFFKYSMQEMHGTIDRNLINELSSKIDTSIIIKLYFNTVCQHKIIEGQKCE